VRIIRGLELTKLIFAVLDVSLMIGLTRRYKTSYLTIIFYGSHRSEPKKSIAKKLSKIAQV